MPDRYGNRRVGFAPALRQGTGRSTIDRQIPNEHRSVLVAAQVAGSFRLLIVAGLFLRSLQSVQHANLGFDPRRSSMLRSIPAKLAIHRSKLGTSTANCWRELGRSPESRPQAWR